jgi:acyl-CoA synthetase (NDP forming)
VQTTGVKRLIQKALASGHGALSEYDSKRLLSAYGVPVTREKLVKTATDAK